jgi:hypothetical protein
MCQREDTDVEYITDCDMPVLFNHPLSTADVEGCYECAELAVLGNRGIFLQLEG